MRRELAIAQRIAELVGEDDEPTRIGLAESHDAVAEALVVLHRPEEALPYRCRTIELLHGLSLANPDLVGPWLRSFWDAAALGIETPGYRREATRYLEEALLYLKALSFSGAITREQLSWMKAFEQGCRQFLR